MRVEPDDFLSSFSLSLPHNPQDLTLHRILNNTTNNSGENDSVGNDEVLVPLLIGLAILLFVMFI